MTNSNTVTTKEWIGFLGLVFGMFMAILDIQIVASSLPHIQAGLSATADEITWIQTSYLIAEVIMIPISGWLAEALSTRVLYTISCAGFTIMSLLCALSWDLDSMILFRSLQGFFGGAMIPTVFSTVYTIFPKHMQTGVTILIGMVVTMAPTFGPILGGALTDIASWHALFLVNIIPGILVCVTTWFMVDVDKPKYELFDNIDFKGIAYMGIFLGTLQYVLEEGSREDWFESIKICILSIASISFFVLLIRQELTYKNPVINLYSFKNNNFTIGCILSFIIGIGLYNAVFILPVFLATVKGLSSFQIGMYMTVTGAFQFLSAPLAGNLSRFVDLRKLLGIGIILFALGCYMNSNLTKDSGFWEFFIAQAIRGTSLMFCFIPINSIAFGTLEKSEIKNASGLYNLMRNLGGAIFLAIIATNMTNWRRENYQHINESMSDTIYAYGMNNFTNHGYHIRLLDDAPYVIKGLSSAIASRPNIYNPEAATLTIMKYKVYEQASIISFNNAFKMISVIFLLGLLTIPFIDKVSATEDSGGH